MGLANCSVQFTEANGTQRPVETSTAGTFQWPRPTVMRRRTAAASSSRTEVLDAASGAVPQPEKPPNGEPKTKSYSAIKHSGVAVVALFFASPSISASAQENAPPPWLDVTIVQVKGGMQLDFEDRVKELQAARRAGGMQPIQVFSVASGHPNEFHLVNPVQSLAAANSEPPPMEPAALASWFGRITSTVENVRFFYAITYPQHGIQGNQAATPPELLVLRTTRVISGKETEYENWIANQYMPAFRQTNPIGHTMARGVFGDNVSNFYHAVPVANWAALDAGDPVERQVGERRMEQMLNGLDGIVDSSELIVARIRYDLMGENQN